MRNKLFLAFIAIVLLVLITHLIDEHFISRDFEDYVNGTNQDKLYWIMAAVEGSYTDGKWDHMPLHEAIHWAIMLGFDVRVLDMEKKEVINSAMVMDMLSPSMKRRMASVTDLSSATGEFEAYPLYEGEREIGTLLVRQMNRPEADSKAAIFRQLAPTSGAMGYGFPAALAAKAVYPKREVVCADGDGCFMMASNELATAVQYGLDVVTIVSNNSVYGTIRMHQEREYPARVSGTDLKNPDFAAYARSFGAFGATVTRTEDFPAAYQEAKASGLPAVIDLKTSANDIAPGRTIEGLRGK